MRVQAVEVRLAADVHAGPAGGESSVLERLTDQRMRLGAFRVEPVDDRGHVAEHQLPELLRIVEVFAHREAARPDTFLQGREVLPALFRPVLGHFPS